jgi:hypothetical protein
VYVTGSIDEIANDFTGIIDGREYGAMRRIVMTGCRIVNGKPRRRRARTSGVLITKTVVALHWRF